MSQMTVLTGVNRQCRGHNNIANGWITNECCHDQAVGLMRPAGPPRQSHAPLGATGHRTTFTILFVSTQCICSGSLRKLPQITAIQLELRKIIIFTKFWRDLSAHQASGYYCPTDFCRKAQATAITGIGVLRSCASRLLGKILRILPQYSK